LFHNSISALTLFISDHGRLQFFIREAANGIDLKFAHIQKV